MCEKGSSKRRQMRGRYVCQRNKMRYKFKEKLYETIKLWRKRQWCFENKRASQGAAQEHKQWVLESGEDNCMGERSGLSLYLNRDFKRERERTLRSISTLGKHTEKTVWRISRNLILSQYVFVMCQSLYMQYHVILSLLINNNVKLLFL